jgi:hypothetical protein
MVKGTRLRAPFVVGEWRDNLGQAGRCALPASSSCLKFFRGERVRERGLARPRHPAESAAPLALAPRYRLAVRLNALACTTLPANRDCSEKWASESDHPGSLLKRGGGRRSPRASLRATARRRIQRGRPCEKVA